MDILKRHLILKEEDLPDEDSGVYHYLFVWQGAKGGEREAEAKKILAKIGSSDHLNLSLTTLITCDCCDHIPGAGRRVKASEFLNALFNFSCIDSLDDEFGFPERIPRNVLQEMTHFSRNLLKKTKKVIKRVSS